MPLRRSFTSCKLQLARHIAKKSKKSKETAQNGSLQ